MSGQSVMSAAAIAGGLRESLAVPPGPGVPFNFMLKRNEVSTLLDEREELRAMLSEAECPMCEPGVAPVDPGCPWCAKRRDLGAAP